MTISIEIYADPICPWCFIGKRRLERALGMPGATAEAQPLWRAFQLNPGMPAQGMDRETYLSRKFGGTEAARQVYEVIRREGEAEGICFAFSRIARTPNTVAAHRLIRRAGDAGRAWDMAERLFTAYFLEGLDIGDHAVLARLAGGAGLDPEETVAWLAGDDGRAEILAEDSAARAAGISGVPHFVIGGRIALSGAQPPEVIVRAVELARERTTGDGD